MSTLAEARAMLAGVDNVIKSFEAEDTLDKRIHVLSVAAVCLLNLERDRLAEEIAKLEKCVIILPVPA